MNPVALSLTHHPLGAGVSCRSAVDIRRRGRAGTVLCALVGYMKSDAGDGRIMTELATHSFPLSCIETEKKWSLFSDWITRYCRCTDGDGAQTGALLNDVALSRRG